MPKYNASVISGCMFTSAPLDVTINLHSFMCVQRLSIKLQFIMEGRQCVRLATVFH